MEPNPLIEKRRRHTLAEQKGREKINHYLNELKNMLPECRYGPVTKASILKCAVTSLKKLAAHNQELLRENMKLYEDLEYFQATVKSSDISSIQEDLLEIPPFPDSKPDFQTFIQPSRITSPLFEDELVYAEEANRFSKSKLMVLVFLFLIPFFLTLQGEYFPWVLSKWPTSRILQSSYNEPGWLFSTDYMRVLWYLVVGIVCVGWLVRIFLSSYGFERVIRSIVSKLEIFSSRSSHMSLL